MLSLVSQKLCVVFLFLGTPNSQLTPPYPTQFWCASRELIFRHSPKRSRQCSHFSPCSVFRAEREVMYSALWGSRLCPNLPIKVMAVGSNSDLSFHPHLAAIWLNKASRAGLVALWAPSPGVSMPSRNWSSVGEWLNKLIHVIKLHKTKIQTHTYTHIDRMHTN